MTGLPSMPISSSAASSSKSSLDLKKRQLQTNKKSSLALEKKLLEAVEKKNFQEACTILESKEQKGEKANKVDINCQLSPHYDTPLHIAVRNNDNQMVRKLLEHGAKSYITNGKYETPFQLIDAKQGEIGKENAIVLLEYRLPMDREYLTNLLDFCCEHYGGHDRERMDYAVNRLVGLNIQSLVDNNEKWGRLIAHLKDIKLKLVEEKDEGKRSKKTSEIELDGWHQHEFLPLRIRALFEIAVRLKREIIVESELPSIEFPSDRRQKILEVVCEELLVEVETLHVRQAINIIGMFNDKRKPKPHPKMVEALSKNIVRHLPQFLKKEGDEYSIPSGWVGHAIYISFEFYKEGETLIRIDNLGYGVHKHPSRQGGDSMMYSPRILGKIPFLLLISYINSLINAKANSDLKERDAILIIYNTKGIESISSAKNPYPYSLPQKANTCVVASHNVSLQVRMKRPELYRWVLIKELQIHAGRNSEIQVDLGRFWEEHTKPHRIPPFMLLKLKEYYRSQTKISLLFNDAALPREVPIEQCYVPLSLSMKKKIEEEFLDDKTTFPEGKSESKTPESVKKPKEEKSPRFSNEKLISLSEVFNECKSSSKRALLYGDAGMGKSTLCQKIVFEWIKDEPWLRKFKFECVFRIPLRHLTQQRYPGPINIVDVVRKECLPPELLSGWFQEQLNKILERDQVLWLLDGWDELPHSLSEPLKAVIKTLLDKRHFIVTSRYSRNLTLPLPLDVPIGEVAGFIPHSQTNLVHTYIRSFFKTLSVGGSEGKATDAGPRGLLPEGKEAEPLSSQAEGLITFLNEHESIAQIAYTPINLELICSIWHQSPAQLKAIHPLTITTLYHQIILWLLRRFLQKSGYDARELEDERRLLRRLQDEIDILERVAFQMVCHDEVTLTHEMFEERIPSIKNDKELAKDIINIHLLKPTGLSQEYGPYEFIHRTFQEFFAARYLVKGLCEEPRAERYKESIDFIRRGKYSDFYRVVFEFTAGLLSLPKREEAQFAFWEALQGSPYDLTGAAYARLLIQCLEQTNNIDVIFQKCPEIIKFLKTFLPSCFKGAEGKHGLSVHMGYQSLSHALQRSLRVVVHPEIQEAVLSSLCVFDKREARIGKALILKANTHIRPQLIEMFEKQLFFYDSVPIITDVRSSYAARSLREVVNMEKRLLEAIDQGDMEKAIRAVWLLGELELNNEEVINTLLALLKCTAEGSEQIREYAALALGQIGNYEDKIYKALKETKEKDSHEEVRKAADWALEELDRKMGSDAYWKEQEDIPDDYSDEFEEHRYKDLTSAERWAVYPLQLLTSRNAPLYKIKGHSCRLSDEQYREYQLRRLDEGSGSILSLEKLIDNDLKILLQKRLYLATTNLNDLIDLFIQNKNSLWVRFIATRVFEQEVPLAIVEDGIVIYNQALGAKFRRVDKDILKIFIHEFSEQAKKYGVSLLGDIRLIQSECQRVSAEKKDKAKADNGILAEGSAASIGQLSGFMVSPQPTSKRESPSVEPTLGEGHNKEEPHEAGDIGMDL